MEDEKHWSRVHMHASAGDGDWFDERCVTPNPKPQTPNPKLTLRLFAAETSSLYKWKKRCSKPSWCAPTASAMHMCNTFLHAQSRHFCTHNRATFFARLIVALSCRYGDTPLHLAALKGRIAIAKVCFHP